MADRVREYSFPASSVRIRCASAFAEISSDSSNPHLFMQRIIISDGGCAAPEIYFESIGWLFFINLAKSHCDSPDISQAFLTISLDLSMFSIFLLTGIFNVLLFLIRIISRIKLCNGQLIVLEEMPYQVNSRHQTGSRTFLVLVYFGYQRERLISAWGAVPS